MPHQNIFRCRIKTSREARHCPQRDSLSRTFHRLIDLTGPVPDSLRLDRTIEQFVGHHIRWAVLAAAARNCSGVCTGTRLEAKSFGFRVTIRSHRFLHWAARVLFLSFPMWHPDRPMRSVKNSFQEMWQAAVRSSFVRFLCVTHCSVR